MFTPGRFIHVHSPIICTDLQMISLSGNSFTTDLRGCRKRGKSSCRICRIEDVENCVRDVKVRQTAPTNFPSTLLYDFLFRWRGRSTQCNVVHSFVLHTRVIAVVPKAKHLVQYKYRWRRKTFVRVIVLTLNIGRFILLFVTFSKDIFFGSSISSEIAKSFLGSMVILKIILGTLHLMTTKPYPLLEV